MSRFCVKTLNILSLVSLICLSWEILLSCIYFYVMGRPQKFLQVGFLFNLLMLSIFQKCMFDLLELLKLRKVTQH